MKAILEALDGQPITPRTGISKITGTLNSLPEYPGPFILMYDPDQAIHETRPSPGVIMYPRDVERVYNEFRFLSEELRPYKLTIIEKD
jgi:hypothetical protein